MKILIVGGLGYIGARIYEYFYSIKLDVYRSTSRQVCYISSNSDRTLFLDPRDVLQASEVFSSFDVVINTYGMDSSSCSDNPSLALLVNGVYTTNLVHAASKAGVNLFIYFSTAHVYSNPLVGLVNEQSCPSNLHPYATSHSAGESSVLYYSNNFPIKSLVIRLANAFGLPVNPESSSWALYVNSICKDAVVTQSITIKNNPHTILDFVPLTCLELFLADYISPSSKSSCSGILNFGSFSSLSLLSMAKIVQQRCEILFNFSPVLFYSSKDYLTSESRDFQYRSIYDRYFPPVTHQHLVSEVDRLLVFCHKNLLPGTSA